ncbi:MAG: hypothetical protein H0T94_11510 [Acidimicrobiia bacterium]|nr:hypothetical protein [Acidimicrobiia bacterium]
MLAGLGLAAAGLVRLATQPLRPSIGGGPVGWYLAGIIVGLIVAATRFRRTVTESPEA